MSFGSPLNSAFATTQHHPTSQLLHRNLDAVHSDAWYLGFPRGAGPVSDFQLATSFDQGALDHLGQGTNEFAPPEALVSQVILYFPKAKSEAQMLIHFALSGLTPDGRLWLVGDNKGGIKSAPNLIKKLGGKAQKIDGARHCSLLEVADLSPLAQSLGKFQLADYWQQNHHVQDLTLCSLPGVFSHGKLDVGTQVLLDHLPKLTGKVLDFGCGCGVIGSRILQQNPKVQVSFSDVSRLATLATEQTLSTNGLPFEQVFTSDGLSQVSGRYNHIVTNPPFHEGVKTQYETTETLFRNAKRFLKPGGSLILVANRFLQYEPLLAKQFRQVTELVVEKGFKVLQAV